MNAVIVGKYGRAMHLRVVLLGDEVCVGYRFIYPATCGPKGHEAAELLPKQLRYRFCKYPYPVPNRNTCYSRAP